MINHFEDDYDEDSIDDEMRDNEVDFNQFESEDEDPYAKFKGIALSTKDYGLPRERTKKEIDDLKSRVDYSSAFYNKLDLTKE